MTKLQKPRKLLPAPRGTPFKDVDFICWQGVHFTDARAGLEKWLAEAKRLKAEFVASLPKRKTWLIGFRAPLWGDPASDYYNPIGSTGRFVAEDLGIYVPQGSRVAADRGMDELERAACAYYGTLLGLPVLVSKFDRFEKFLKK